MRERELLGVPGCETAAQRLLLLFAGHLMLHWWLQSARQTSAGLGTWCCPSARVGFIDNWAEVGYVTYLQLRDRCLARICAILGTDVWLFTFNTEVLDPFRTQRGFFFGLYCRAFAICCRFEDPQSSHVEFWGGWCRGSDKSALIRGARCEQRGT